MPYISSKDDRRKKLNKGQVAKNAGELNFQIFSYVKHAILPKREDIKKFVDRFLGRKRNYQKYNDMTGALIRCQKEIKRRLNKKINLYNLMEEYDDEINTYEDTKIISNGDVK